MARDVKNLNVLFLIMTILLLNLTLLFSAEAQTWTQLSPTGGPPTQRTEHTAVYDQNSNRMIVFGGRDAGGYLNEVWVLTNANGLGGTPNWIQLSPTGGPPSARILHTAIYDPGNNRMTVYGGWSGSVALGDVWVLTNANGLGGTPNWTQLSPTGGPPNARERHTAVHDQSNNRMIIFGGRDAFPNSFGDAWVLTNANGLGGTPNWTQLSPTGGPPAARTLHTSVYDQNTNRMIMFAGRGNSGSLNDVWVLVNANGLGGTPNWTQLSPIGGPPSARDRHTAVYNPINNQMIIFAGTPSPYLNDVWVLSNANGNAGTPNWTQLNPTGGPPTARSATSAVYDSSSGRMIIFGGWACLPVCAPSFNDVWVLSDIPGIPALTQWGMLFFALVAGTSAVYVLKRRKLKV